MINKIIIGTLIVATALIAVVWFARPQPVGDEGPLPSESAAAQNDSSLVVEESNNYDFGSISMAAGKVSRQFKLKNTSADEVVVTKMYTSCMCTTAELTVGDRKFGPYGMPGHGFVPRIDEKMAAGKEATAEVVFDPAAHGPAGIGRIERTVVIENSAGKPVELRFSATVRP